MKTITFSVSLLVAGALGAIGHAAYRAATINDVTELDAIFDVFTRRVEKQIPPKRSVDPSTWSIPQGEAATRRHIETGIKAGDIDPMTGQGVLYYHDPMVPGRRFDSPGKSPFMDMMLVPVFVGAGQSDRGTVFVSPRMRQNLGMRTAEVREGILKSRITAVGTIAWNERDQVVLQARATSFVEKLHVSAALDSVVEGQPMFDLYVPQWVAAQEEFLSVRRMRGVDIAQIEDAARQRMRQAGMTDVQIALVERRGEAQAHVTLYSPINGILGDLAVREGSTVTQGMTLARINSLATVWAHAEVPESQLSLLRVGARVSANSPAMPGTTFQGQIEAVLPEIDQITRTVKARMMLPNPDFRLTPGMFVNLSIDTKGNGSTLLVPSEALIHTGERTLVMVADDEAGFRPVEVTTGIEANGTTSILHGLESGWKVIVSGQFLIDSEASLKGVEARMGESTPSLTQTHRTPARVEALHGDRLTLTHPAVPTLNWPEMTMDFRLATDLHIPALIEGQQVEIEFQIQEGDVPKIISVRDATSTGAKP